MPLRIGHAQIEAAADGSVYTNIEAIPDAADDAEELDAIREFELLTE